MGSKQSKDQKGLITLTNEIVSNSIVKTMTRSIPESTVTQDVELLCDPSKTKLDKDNPNISVYEENSSCTRCINNVKNDLEAHIALEKLKWDSSEIKVRQPIDTFYSDILEKLETCGVTVCKACVFSNITQSNILNANADCIQNFRDTSGIQGNISSLLKQQLLNNKDALAGVVSALKDDNLESITDNISNRITSTMSENFFKELSSRIQDSQTLVVKGSNIKLNQLSQDATFTIIEKYVDKVNIALLAYSSETFKALAIEINNQNTLNDLGDVVFESSISFVNALDSSIGKVMFAVLISLGIVFVSVIIYSLYAFIKNTTSTAKDITKALKTNSPPISKYVPK
jgi:hypothetical protein